jgi:hypothetical protein
VRVSPATGVLQFGAAFQRADGSAQAVVASFVVPEATGALVFAVAVVAAAVVVLALAA